MQTEMQLKGTIRDHGNRLITSIPKNEDNITLKYWKESISELSAFVQVVKSTIIPTKSTKMVHS